MEQGYWFKSELFEITKGEDSETNPGRYGKSLANWLRLKLSESGYSTEVIPEYWGWCVMCQSDDYMLWVGCGVMQTEEFDESNPPVAGDVIWHVFPHIEVPVFMFKSKLRKWFGKLDTKAPLQKLDAELRQILEAEKSVQFCSEP